MTRRGFQSVILIGLLAALAVGNVIATHQVLTEPYPGHNDFLTSWESARSFWRDGLSPYSEATILNIQQRIYGRPAAEDEFPNYFAYPFYTVLVVWPLVYTSYAWASAIWMVLLETCLIGLLLLLLDLYSWRPVPWLAALLMLWMLVNYYSARGLILGQPGTLVCFLQVVVLWALARRLDRLAGIALALTTIKPQVGFLLVPFLLLWGFKQRRWGLVGAFGVVWSGLVLASFALEPSWLGSWIEELRRYPSYTEIGSPVWIITRYYLGLGPAGEWIGNLALLGLVLWSWHMVLIQEKTERAGWTIMLTLTVTHLAALRTATPHFVIFTVPLVFYGWLIAERLRRGSAAVASGLVILLLIPWLHFLLTVEGDFEHPSVYLPLPVGMLILLWLTRRVWWTSPPIWDSSRRIVGEA